MSDRSERSLGGRVKRTVQSKILVPLAATAVSAGVSYLAKKLPLIIEDKLVPKLREQGAPELARKVETVGSVLPGDGGEQQAEEESGPEASAASNDEREAERREREKRREERKRALSSA